MKKDEKKRYLVSYSDGDLNSSDAAEILGITKNKIKDGVSFMETDAVPGKDDIMHFENVGVTSIELSMEEVDELKTKEGVLAVEEDTEMHIMEISNEEQVDDTFNDDLNMDQYQSGLNDAVYQDGYDKALLDIFASFLKLKREKSSTSGSATETPSLLPQPTPIPFPPYFRQPIPWNINLVKAPIAWARGIAGTGVNVAVVDTGISAHPDLKISGGVSFVPGVTSYKDGNSHGTHCAGIIGARNNLFGVVGVAPLCNLYAVKVLSDAGSGSSSWIIAGMDWCIRNKMKVISMSLGGLTPPMLAYSNAIRKCQENGITVVIASGNSYLSTFPWVCAPANSFIVGGANERPIAVGAIDQSCNIAYFSSRGGQTPFWNQVTVVAPGVKINSTVLANAYGLKSGTSMACPHVAGLAALLCQRFPGITPVMVKRRIIITATNLGPIGFDLTYGYGLINCDLATR